MDNKIIYEPKKCDKCSKSFIKGDKAIKHDDINRNYFFCCDSCYIEWLKDNYIRDEITVGVEDTRECCEICEELREGCIEVDTPYVYIEHICHSCYEKNKEELRK